MFQSKKRKSLQPVIAAIQNDLANNYKDNAVEGIMKLRKELEENGDELKTKEQQELKNLLMHFEEDVRNFKRTY
ncbi:MAG: hypothetical protein IKQ49_10585 [Eubacterium sp.]|nr:hypothetical protein [Eubacterium sp.]